MDYVIGICAMEIRDPDARWERFLALERLVQAPSEVWFHTQSLKDKNTHPDETLFGRIIPLFDSVEQYQYDEIMGAICVDDE